MPGMYELEYSINKAGSVGALAALIGVRQNVVSNWRMRNSVPEGWLAYLRLRFKIPKQSTAEA